MDEETQVKLTNDFEVGQYIRESIVPRAILYYTGEALADEEDDEYDEEVCPSNKHPKYTFGIFQFVKQTF